MKKKLIIFLLCGLTLLGSGLSVFCDYGGSGVNNDIYEYFGLGEGATFEDLLGNFVDSSQVDPSYYQTDEYKNSGFTSSPTPPTSATSSDVTITTGVAKKTESGHEHDYKTEVIQEATCKEEGVTRHTCECGDFYEEPIPAGGDHEYAEDVKKEPTCTESGIKTFTCSKCGDTYNEDIPALGHDFTEEVTKEATCTEDGVKTKTCKVCETTEEEVIPATGHTETGIVITKNAGLFTNGLKENKCSVCGEVLESEVVKSTLPLWSLVIMIIGGIGIVTGLVVVIRKKKIERK